MIFRKILLPLLSVLIMSGTGFAQDNSSEITINMKAIAGLQFDVVRFQVKPGTKVKIVLTNTDDMSHNFVIVKPASRLKVVNASLKLEEKGPGMNFIPAMPEVLWSIPVVAPEQSRTLSFTAPAQSGAYPYVCTYTGHGFSMYGVMYVSADGVVPDLKNDQNVPPGRRLDKAADAVKTDPHAGHNMAAMPAEPVKPIVPHPYELVPPYLYRTFMDDSSPAAIAVCLPQNIAYCWDAGTCRLRYAWMGTLDNTAVWKGHSDAVGKPTGPVFYREADFPLHIGKDKGAPVIAFKGYRLVNKYPEFHYTINGTDVYELIQPKDDGNGLIRKFRIPGVSKAVSVALNVADESIRYEASAGKIENSKLTLTAQEAKEFSLTITSYQLVYTKKAK